MAPTKYPALSSLSVPERLRVTGFLRRGEAPRDPRIAAAVVEWGEHCQREANSRKGQLLRWLSPVFAVTFAAATGWLAVLGAPLQAALVLIAALLSVVHLMISPQVRPKRIARSVAESRVIAAQRIEPSASDSN